MITPAEPRIPPRFVPTLTEVVSVPDGMLPAPGEGPLALLDPAGQPGRDRPQVPPQATEAPWSADHMDAWSEQVAGRVIAQLEQRLPALLEEHARLWSQAAAQTLRQELPAMVQEAVRTTCPSPDPWQAGDVDPQRGLSAIHAANNDPG